MSPGVDRRIGNSLFPAVIAVLVLIAAGGGAFYWYRTSSSNAPVQPVRIPVRFDEPLAVNLAIPVGDVLVAQATTVKRQPDTQSQAREVLNALLADPRGAQSPVLAGLKLRAFFLDSGGTAFVDVLPVAGAVVRASAGEELLGLYAFVDTLTQNFEEIRQVRFLLEGREAQTLAGHIDLARTFTKRSDLVKQ